MRAYLDILRLVWPLALGMVNNALMQFVDRAYLARESMSSLEAVLPAGMLAWIFLGFFQAVVGYSGVFVAQYHGAKDEARCRSVFRVAMLMALVAGVAMLPLKPFGDFLLALTASETLLGKERAYYDVMVLGGVFVYVMMAAASYFTGRGKTRIVFWTGLVGNMINVVLDPVLIFGWWGLPKLGIRGAALATVASIAVQTALLVFAAVREMRRSPQPRVSSRGLVADLLRYGVPAGLFEVLNMAAFTIFVFVTEGVGHLELAVSNACFTVNYLLFAPMTGFALGAQTLVGQARGRGDDAAAFTALRRTLILGLAFVAVACALMLAFHHQILSIFSSQTAGEAAEFHRLGFVLLLMMTAWMLFDAADVIVSGALKGVGDTRFVLLWTTVNSFLLWLPVVFVVRQVHNTMPALWATNIGYVVIVGAGSIIRWKRGNWRARRMIDHG